MPENILQSLKDLEKLTFCWLLAFLLLGIEPTWAKLRAGVILPLSGKETVKGQALKGWLEELRLRFFPSISLIFYDSKGKCRTMRKIVEEAYWDGVKVLIGPFDPSCAPELLKETRLFSMPIIVTSGEFYPVKEIGRPFGPYFRTGISSRAAVKVLYRCLKKKGLKNIGLLLTKDRFGKEGEKWLLAYAVEYGLRIQDKRYFGVHDTDVSYHLEALLGCEAVICWAPPKAAAKVAENLATYNFGLPVFFPHFVARENFLLKNAGLYGLPFVGASFLAEKGLYPQKIRRFFERWRKKAGTLRDPIFAAYTDALLFLQKGLWHNRRNWVRGLEKAGLVKGLTGLYFLSTDDHYGLIPGSVGVFRYEGTEFRPLCKPVNKIF